MGQKNRRQRAGGETLPRATFRVLRETRSDYELTEVRGAIISVSRKNEISRSRLYRACPNSIPCATDKMRYKEKLPNAYHLYYFLLYFPFGLFTQVNVENCNFKYLLLLQCLTFHR